MIIDDEIKIALQINGKVRAEMMIGKMESEEEIKTRALKNPSIIKYIADQAPKKVIYVRDRLINIVV